MTAQIPRAGVTEALERRHLLAAVLDANLGILTITGSEEADIIQFLVADTASASAAPASFTVLESTATAPSPPLSFPTRQQVLDFIDSGGTPLATTFSLATVREIRIATEGGDDLVILGRDLPRPVFVDAGEGQDSVSGGDGDDTLLGGPGDDYLFGRDRNDILDGGSGADELLGGVGNDTADYRQRTAGVRANLDDLSDDGEEGEGDNVRADIETLVGGSGDDVLDGSPAAGGLRLHGGDGNDTLIGGSGEDTLLGDAGSDSIAGGAGDDLIPAEDGSSDSIDGGDGQDVALLDDEEVSVDGPPAVDVAQNVEVALDDTPESDPIEAAGGTAVLENGEIRVTGTSGRDRVIVHESLDRTGIFVTEVRLGASPETFVTRLAAEGTTIVAVEGGAGDDLLAVLTRTASISAVLNGGGGRDVVLGSGGNDQLDGGEGDDLLFGRGGDDNLIGRAGADHLSGGDGDDSAVFSDRDDLASVGRLPDDGERGEGDNVQPDVEALLGSDGNDRLTTHEPGPVYLAAGAGRDTLIGGPGDDVLRHGDGTDLLDGRGGADTFYSKGFVKASPGSFPFFGLGSSGGPGSPADYDIIRGGPGDDVIAESDDIDDIDLGEDE